MIKKSNKFPGVEWIEGTGDFIKINEDKCSGCANCVKICLGHCFKIVHQKAMIDSLENCMECASCWYVCPDGALEFAWPKGGTGYRSNWG